LVARPTVFVRDATGLVREISLFGAFALASGNMSVITGWYLFGWFGAAVPGGELGIATLLGTVFILFPALVYAMMSSAFPRSGGDYVFVSRVLYPTLGFLVNFYLAFYWMTAIGFSTPVVVIPNLSALLGIYGTIYNNSTLLGWVAALANVNVATAVAIGFIIMFTVLALLNVRSFYRIMVGMLVMCFLALFLSFAVMWSANPTDFATSFNAFAGTPNLYQTVIANATKAGMAQNWTWGATLGPTLLFAWLMLGGFQFPAFVGGEVKRPTRTLPLAIALAIVFNGLLYAIFYELTYHAFGYAFMNASGFAGVNPSVTPLFVPYFLAVLTKDNPILLFIIQLGYFLGGPWLILTFYAFGTRCIFAWSFDRVVPSKLCQVSERFGTPTYAVLVAAFVYGIFFLLLYNYTSLATYYSNMTLGYVIVTIIVMIAAIVFPYKKKDVFNSSPGFTRMKIGGVPLISIIGAVGFLYLLYVLYGGLTNPSVFGPISGASLGFMVGVLVLSVVIYYASVAYHKSKGVDITLAFKEIPPE
jgi:amino acid transporter